MKGAAAQWNSREVGSAMNFSVEIQTSLANLNLGMGLDKMLLVPAKDSITFLTEMRAIATTSFDYDLGQWISRKKTLASSFGIIIPCLCTRFLS